MPKRRDGYVTQPQPAPDSEGQRPCARVPREWCSGARLVEQPDGTMRREPGLTYQAFCDPCRTRIGACLDELPSAYARLAAAIGDPPRRGQVVRIPFGPRMPLQPAVDELMRYMAAVLGSWHERVAAVARLTPPDTGASRTDPARTVDHAVTVLSGHLTVMLALMPEQMARVMTPADAEAWADDPDAVTVVRPSGEAHVLRPMSGADAGNEIFDLHYQARRILFETKTQPESFDGIPCRGCEDMALERAEPPSDPNLPVMKSRCASCGDTMDDAEFAAWAKLYAKWADSAGLPSCKRCQDDRHEQCAWPVCPCRHAGHAAA